MRRRFTCRLEGEPLALTPIEYRILYALAKDANTLVSRDASLFSPERKILSINKVRIRLFQFPVLYG